MTRMNEKEVLEQLNDNFSDIVEVMEKSLEENKTRLIIYIKFSNLSMATRTFLKDIKTKTINNIAEDKKENAKRILKLKKKFNYFACKSFEELRKEEEKEKETVKITIPVKKGKKKKKKKNEGKKVKQHLSNQVYEILTDAASFEQKQKSVISGIIALRSGEVIATYTKKLRYNPNTNFLESIAILQMMKIAEMEEIEHVLFKTDSESAFNGIQKLEFKESNDIVQQIQSYLIKKTNWNIELVSREKVNQAHKLCRKELA